MNILISNDDGYKSGRLLMLKEILDRYGVVYVAAPFSERSGASISLTIRKPVKYKIISDKVIAVKGNPADSVSVGLNYFKDIDFDLVITGINYGLNTAKDTLYSGTVGASVIASFNNIKTIALSSFYKDDPLLKEKSLYILEYIFKNKLLDVCSFLNVNIPKGEAKGVKVAKIYKVPSNDYMIKVGSGFHQARDVSKEVFPNDSDIYLVKDGYYTITCFKPSLEDETLNKKLMEVIENVDWLLFP